MEFTTLLTFTLAALVVLVIPGPAVAYVVTRSIAQGRRAGLVSVLGASAGALVHVVAAAAGLSAILLASATAFGFIKMLGAAYLIYLGIRALMSRESMQGTRSVRKESMSRIFLDGLLINILNPKIAMFFLAFLPQFVDPGRGSVTFQFIWLGLLYTFLGLVTDGIYAWFAGSTRNWLVRSSSVKSWMRYASGSVFVTLGLGVLLTERKA